MHPIDHFFSMKEKDNAAVYTLFEISALRIFSSTIDQTRQRNSELGFFLFCFVFVSSEESGEIERLKAKALLLLLLILLLCYF